MEVVGWVREELESRQLHPLLVIAIFVVVFLEIHPFQDGNGRVSRILTTLLLLRAGYVYVPCSSLESVIERSKEGYYLALRQTQGDDQNRHAKLAAMGLVLPARTSTADEAAGQESRIERKLSWLPYPNCP